MARMGSFDCKGMEELQRKLDRIEMDLDTFCVKLSRELAARLLRKVILRTPVGDYSKTNTPDKKGGTLRRGWTGGQKLNVSQWKSYVNTVAVLKIGNSYEITITNPVKYGIYVEYGHRQQVGRYVPAIGKRLVKPWVNGQYMLTISEAELRSQAPGIIQKKVYTHLREIFG